MNGPKNQPDRVYIFHGSKNLTNVILNVTVLRMLISFRKKYYCWKNNQKVKGYYMY